MKRLTIIALIVLLIAGVFVSCNEENIVDDEFIPPIDITSETTTLIPGSRYRTVEDTTIADRITIDGEGSVTIILKEGTTLTAEKGINVTEDQEIIIQGTGKLEATGDPKSAGIGGGDGEDGGTVRIQGGDITANGGEGGAGIGGGKGGKSGTTIIEKKEGKAAPQVTTKGGSGSSHGIGNGEDVSEDPKEVDLDGVGLEVSNDGEFWEDYEGDNPEQYMRSYVAVVITYNANGGTGSMPAQKVHAGVATTLNANAYTRTGMSFKGWNTAKDGSGKAYANKASVTLTEDVTLYAQWEVAPTGNYITAETTTIQSGLAWTIQENVVNPNRISIEGTDETAIILPAGLKLEVKQGISVSTGQTLIIDGTGSLVAGEDITGAYGKSGIGGADQYDLGGTIIINSGNITAYGRETGIGGMDYPDCEPLPAEGTLTIEINGGVIHATGNHSAGIGGFKANVTINDGEIHATNDVDGAGIGGYGCTIDISGGTIYATGKGQGAGIGSSGVHDQFDSDQKITISDGEITAIGGIDDGYAGAGIGGGYDCGSGTITITGGTIIATAGSDDADGIGNGGDYSASEPTIIIDTGVLVLSSENNTDWTIYPEVRKRYMKSSVVEMLKIDSTISTLVAGKVYTIDGNSVTNNNRLAINGTEPVVIYLPKDKTLALSNGITVADGQTLEIAGFSTSTLTATGISGDAGIGGLYGGTCGTIIIDGGKVTATGGVEGGAGIGSGCGATNGGTVIINGGTITATGKGSSSGGGAGIGGGQTSNAAVIIEINGGTVTATGAVSAAGIGGGDNSSADITINGGTIVATGGNMGDTGGFLSCGGPGIGGGRYAESVTVNITGGNIIANGTGGGTGIGGAEDASAATIQITISGGRVKATGSSFTDEDSKLHVSAGIGGAYLQSGGTITLSGSPEVKGIGGSADARGIGRGKGTSTEATLNYDDLTVGLQSDDTDEEDYYPYDYYGNRQYMKTSNYHN